MAYDVNLILDGSSTSDVVDITTSAAATQYANGGANRVLHADLRVAGTAGGTNPSLTVILQEGTTANASTWSTIIAFAAQTASMDATNDVSSGPASVTFRTSKAYIRITKTVSSTATFGSVSVRLRPTGEPATP